MATVLKITNTKVNPLTLYYRVPGREGNKMPTIAVSIPARALNHSVAFANDSHADAFKKQNEQFIDRGIIILGKSTESQAEKQNEKNAVAESQKTKEAADAAVDSIEKQVKSTAKKSSLKVSVEKASN